jgi:phospholipid/cholesterol/gamma-HCH transport system permease protein
MVRYYMEQSGAKAVPIIAALCFLLGAVLGYMGGYQLKAIAAESFMPDFVAYAMLWEISPMLAAVIVAGRSGSSFAAEIGTMQVRQEIDALRVMGFNVFGFVVTPKMLALICVMPFLVLLADISGVLGGMIIGSTYLKMPVHVYLSRTSFILYPIDVWWGMLKSVVYAIIVANVGCYMGMKVRGGAAEVGRATTSAVVAGIFLVIVADAIIAIIWMHVRPPVVV